MVAILVSSWLAGMVSAGLIRIFRLWFNRGGR